MNLTCNMTYYTSGDDARLNLGAIMSLSFGWEPGAGTILDNTTTTLVTTGRQVIIGGILRADVQTIASGEMIPSYNCTAQFRFTNGSGTTASSVHALNSVSWTCASAPVLTWCKYYIVHMC